MAAATSDTGRHNLSLYDQDLMPREMGREVCLRHARNANEEIPLTEGRALFLLRYDSLERKRS